MTQTPNEKCPCGSKKNRPDCHGSAVIDVRDPDAPISYLTVFGFPEFQEYIYGCFREYFMSALPRFRRLAFDMLREVRPGTVARDKIFGAGPESAVYQAVHVLASSALSSHIEVIVLAGNGLGRAAAGSVRYIVETSFLVDYLMLVPQEASRFVAMASYGLWTRINRLREMGVDYTQFVDADEMKEKADMAKRDWGKLGWNFEVIAKKIHREKEYEAIYRTLSSLAHPSAEGVGLRAEEGSSGTKFIAAGASTVWCDIALMLGHRYLLETLHAFNELFMLGYDHRLHEALSDYMEAWSEYATKAELITLQNSLRERLAKQGSGKPFVQ
jgi:Family of unknown function (DUF5677)